jgi:hypothetical protein
MSPANVRVCLEVTVSDPLRLWLKAAVYLRGQYDGDGTVDILGSPADPDIGACLIMLLDRSENLDGAEITDSSSELINA